MYKFEKLEVWQLALDYADLCYKIAEALPEREKYNLTSQLCRASVSVTLNIAEGSTGQSDAEQSRFVSMALRSVIETVACFHLIYRRRYLDDPLPLREAYKVSERLSAKLQALRRALGEDKAVREDLNDYVVTDHTPFDALP